MFFHLPRRRTSKKKQKNKKALKYGLLLTLLALFLASVTDEISSAIGVQVQSSVVTEFFVRPLNVPYNEAMAMFSTATTFSYFNMGLPSWLRTKP